MQEVIRLELCGVTRGRGGMVSLRGVRHVVTPRKAGRGLLLSLGGSCGVDRSIPVLISFPLKVVLQLWNVPVPLRMC